MVLLLMLLAAATPMLAQSIRAQTAPVPLDESGKEGVVELLYVTSFGERVPERRATVKVARRPDGGWIPHGSRRPMTLTYGTYLVRVEYEAAAPVEKLVRVDQPWQTVPIGIYTLPIELPESGNLLRGVLSEEGRKRDCRWVRLISPFSENVAAETRATETGHFSWENIRAGKYWILALNDEGVCEMAGVEILGKRLYDLNLHWQQPPAMASDK